MAANELKKLNRRELLELLIGEMRESDRREAEITPLTEELKTGVPLSQDEFENLVLRPLRQEYENGCSAPVEQAKELLNIPGEKTE